MVRDALQPLYNHRKRFEGVFVRFGEKHFKEHVSTTVLLRDIHLKGDTDILCDHVWLNLTKRLEECSLEEGDIISFEARVVTYTKGYQGRRRWEDDKPIEYDYKLSHPTDVKLRRVKDNPTRTDILVEEIQGKVWF